MSSQEPPPLCFLNAVFSPSLTQASFTPPGETAPPVRPAQFLGDNPANQTAAFTNTTGSRGRTWAVYIFGNADHTHYQFQASVSGAEPITLTGYATLFDPWWGQRQLAKRVFEDTRPFYVDALAGYTISVYATVLNYSLANPSCLPSNPCIVNTSRVAGCNVEFARYLDGPYVGSMYRNTNSQGVATLDYLLPSGWTDIEAWTDYDFRWITSLNGTGIDIQVDRMLPDFTTVAIADGGNVFFTDQGVQVIIDNTLWKELTLAIEEKPNVSGQDVLALDNNSETVLSQTLNTYFLFLASETAGGEVTLKLKNDLSTLGTFTFTVSTANTVDIFPIDNPFNNIPNIAFSPSETFRVKLEGKDVNIPKNNFIIVALDGTTTSLDYTISPHPGNTVEARAYASDGYFHDAQLVDGRTVFVGPFPLISSNATPWNLYIHSPAVVRSPNVVAQVLAINQSVYDSNRTDLEINYFLPTYFAFGYKIRTILALFLGLNGYIPDNYEPSNLENPSQEGISATNTSLTHKVGVGWDGSGDGHISKYYWESDTHFSQDFESSNSFQQSWIKIINDTDCLELKSVPEGSYKLLFYPAGSGMSFDKWTEYDFYYSIKTVSVSGDILLKMGPPNSDPHKINGDQVDVDAYVDDLTDYKYFSGGASIPAAIVQAGWLKYHNESINAGNIFYNQFHIVYTSSSQQQYSCK